jgi:hypothetical protein
MSEESKREECGPDGWCDWFKRVHAAQDAMTRPFEVVEEAYEDGSLRGALYLWVGKKKHIKVRCCPCCGSDPQARFQPKKEV